MDKDEIIGQLQAVIAQLDRENEALRARIRQLDAQLASYENAHTPPSLRRGGTRKTSRNKGAKGQPGQKKGHTGVTRPPAKPDKHVEVTTERCPDCGTELGDQFRAESRIIEDIPEPQPVIVTEYKISRYTFPRCRLTKIVQIRYQHNCSDMQWRETVCPFHQPHTAMLAGASTSRIKGKDLAEMGAEAVPLHKALTRLYMKLTDALGEDQEFGDCCSTWREQRLNAGSAGNTSVRRWKSAR